MVLKFPPTKMANELVFMLNTDDFTKDDAQKVARHIKSLGLDYKRSMYYHKVKTIGWRRFSIDFTKPVSWSQNKTFSEELITEALKS